MECDFHVYDVDSPTLKILCPIWCTLWAASYRPILMNYGTLMKLWGWEKGMSLIWLEGKNNWSGDKNAYFEFLHGLKLAILVLSHSYKLSSSLQRAGLCALDAQKNAKLSVAVHQGIRSDRNASFHCTMVTQAALKLWSNNYHHGHTTKRYHQDILSAMLNLSTIQVWL